jgi:hypothetical protein
MAGSALRAAKSGGQRRLQAAPAAAEAWRDGDSIGLSAAALTSFSPVWRKIPSNKER